MAFTIPSIPTLNIEQQDPITHLVSSGTILGVPPVVAETFSEMCILQDLDGSGIYKNTGTVAAPVWAIIT